MNRKIIITGDGSCSVSIPETNLYYHSIHGAVTESAHVYISAGLMPLIGRHKSLRLLEMGFGTGLNALLTLSAAEKEKQEIHYCAIDIYPLEKSLLEGMNYCHALDRADLQESYNQMHNCPWEIEIQIKPFFSFCKLQQDIVRFKTANRFNLIYFDPFDPVAQPALWERQVFDNLFSLLAPAGILVTYSSSGKARRAMQAAGFRVEKLPGPPHKREMLRAIKDIDMPNQGSKTAPTV